MERCRWEWLFGIENRDRVFPIHRSYKFNPVIVEKGGATEAIRTAFMRRNLDDWERAEELVTPYTRAQVKRFSPRSRAILEIQSQRDLEILEKIYANAVLLGDDGPDGWGIRYTTEFHMTNDSRLFPPRPRREAKGYRPDEYSRELLGDDGYLTVLLEIRARSVVDEDTYWTTVGALRDGGLLDDSAYGQLLDELHSRGYLDDLDYRRRRGCIPSSPSAERYLRVAEEPAEYRGGTPPQDPQPDLFE